MATATAKKKASPKKSEKTFTLLRDNYENMCRGEYMGMGCCAFVEFSGVNLIQSVEDAIAIRRLASGFFYPNPDDYLDENGDSLSLDIYVPDVGTDGMVLVTSIETQKNKEKYLLGAGFEKFTVFKRRSRRVITLWGARTIANSTYTPTKPRQLCETVRI